MAKYSLINKPDLSVLEEAVEILETPPIFTQAEKPWVWVPFTLVEVTIDDAIEIREPDVVVVSETEHTITQQKRALTQQEIDQRDSDLKDAEIERFQDDRQRAAFEGIFNHENRIRAIEKYLNNSGQTQFPDADPVTRAQLRNALRSLLDAL